MYFILFNLDYDSEVKIKKNIRFVKKNIYKCNAKVACVEIYKKKYLSRKINEKWIA